MPGVEYPRVPGHEVIGVITRLGAGVTGWSVGQRVGVGWSGGGEKVTGLTVDGGYTSRWSRTARLSSRFRRGSRRSLRPRSCARASRRSARSGPARRAWETSWRSRGLAVSATSPSSSRRRAGFRTVAISRGRQKEALAKELGAHAYIDGDAEDVGQALQAMGAAVVLATAPSAKAISAAVGGLRRDGEVVIVAGSGEKLDVSADRAAAARGDPRRVGDGPKDIVDTVQFSMLTGVETRVEAFPLARATEAYDAMMKATVRFRAVLTMQ